MIAQNIPGAISRVINEVRGIPGVKACAVISKTGTLIAHDFPGNGMSSAASSLVGVMCASVISSAEGVASIIDVGSPNQIIARSSDAMIVITSAGDAAYLIAVLKDSGTDCVATERIHAIAERIGSV
jgi:predicted regulator of Ras-like GTPase activity (Roadblock/LC7/MglB family)